MLGADLIVPPSGSPFIAFIIAGQLIGSIQFDHLGLLGVPIHQLNPARLIGAGMLVFGAILARQ